MTMKLDSFELNEITSHLRRSGVDKADAVGIWTVKQLTAQLKRVYERDYPTTSVVNLFPVSNEIPSHAKYFEYPELDAVGVAQIVADYSDDLPLVDALMTEKQGKVFRFGNAYLISIDEIKAGAALGSSLQTRKQNVAFEAHDNLLDKLVWKGSAPHGIKSVFEASNVNQVTPTGAWTSPEVASNDITRLIDSIETATQGFHRANRILLPASMRRLMQQLATNTTVSYQELYTKNNPGVELQYLALLDDYDGAGGKAALAYEYDPMNMSIEIPEATNALPMQPKDLHFKVPVTSKTTGLVIYRPLTIAVMKGITAA